MGKAIAELWATMGKRAKTLEMVFCAVAVASIVAGIVFKEGLLPTGVIILLLGISMLMLFKGINGALSLLSAAFAVFGLVLFLNGCATVISAGKDARFTASLGGEQEILAKKNSSGTKYVVYDKNKERFRYQYLPDEYQAETAEQIAAILNIMTDYRVTGHYSSGDEACQYFVTIEIVDAESGEGMGGKTIYGGEPPETIVKKTLAFWDRQHYGSAPSKDDIKQACIAMIKDYEKEKERKARVELMTEDELYNLIINILSDQADQDGWMGISKIIGAIQEKNPDFKFSDYGCSAWDFFKDDPRFETRMEIPSSGDLLHGAELYFVRQR